MATTAPLDEGFLAHGPTVGRGVVVRAGDIELDAWRHGPNQGRPLLLIMGLAMQRIAWPARLLVALRARGFVPISFDNRDIGLSTRLDRSPTPNPVWVRAQRLLGISPRVPYRLADMADDALAVLDHFGIGRAHVFGVSMGGMIAQHLAARAPERVASLGLAMTSSGRASLPLPRPEVLRILASRPATADLEAAVAYQKRLFRVIGSPAHPLDPGELERRARRAALRAPAGSGPLRQMAAIAAESDRGPMLRRLRLPVAIWHGEADRMVPVAHAHDLARNLAGATLQILPGWGHDLPDALADPLADGLAALADRAG